uniref:Putative DNA helicase INO80 n=1 Tax=Phallusia mammillata TaxID=59560 RepID=A0A6F9DEM4_9ASCI|nr:putative DNA helicase INO80 [Phallusia mammillata]
MLMTRLLTTNVRRFSTLYRKPAPKQLLVKVAPAIPMRSMSGGIEMKPLNAVLWFVGLSVPIVIVAYAAGKQILGRFDQADAGLYGPPLKRITNDEWLELKGKILAMADTEEEDEDEEEGEAEATSETASTVAEAIEEEDFVMIAEEGVTEQVSQEVGKDTIIFVEPPKSE